MLAVKRDWHAILFSLSLHGGFCVAGALRGIGLGAIRVDAGFLVFKGELSQIGISGSRKATGPE